MGATQHSSRSRADGERGIIILVALLVLLSLAGIAIVAAHRVSLEIDRSGNYRMQKDGALVTQVGFMAGLGLLEQQGNTVMEQMRASADTATGLDPGDQANQRKVRLRRDSFGSLELFDESDSGSFGRDVAATAPDFVTHIEVIGESDGAVAGFSAGEYTFSRVVMTTWGSFGVKNTSTDDIDDQMVLSSAQNQMRVFLLVGPQTVPQVAR